MKVWLIVVVDPVLNFGFAPIAFARSEPRFLFTHGHSFQLLAALAVDFIVHNFPDIVLDRLPPLFFID